MAVRKTGHQGQCNYSTLTFPFAAPWSLEALRNSENDLVFTVLCKLNFPGNKEQTAVWGINEPS
jgi:hypothetical protein